MAVTLPEPEPEGRVSSAASPDNRQADRTLYRSARLDYRSVSVDEYVANYTDGKGFDIVYDTVGGDALTAVLTAAKHYGHITSCGAFGTYDITNSSLRCTTLSAVFVLLPMLTGEKRTHHGQLLCQLTEWVENGLLKPVVDPRYFTLDTAMEAHGAVEDSSACVKVVIDIT